MKNKRNRIYYISILFVVTLFVFGTLSSYKQNEFVDFKLVSVNLKAKSRKGLYIVYENIEINEGYKKQLVFVFDFYHIEYKISKEGSLLIMRKYVEDLDLMANITKKSTDKEWLKIRTVVVPN